MLVEVEQWWQWLQLASSMPRIREFGIRIAELIKEGVNHRINGPEALRRSVFEEFGNQVDCISVGLAEDLAERVWLDLREFVFHIVGVHGSDLLASRCTQNLDNLNQLVDARLTGKQWLAKHQFCHDATRGPYIFSHRKEVSEHSTQRLALGNNDSPILVV